MDKKAKLEELKAVYQRGQAQVRGMTENLLRIEGSIALLTDLIAEDDKAAAASPAPPGEPHDA